MTAVMALDEEVSSEVQLLKRNLLRRVDTKEFAPAATFSNPCRSFVLPDVICQFCHISRDIDLCRDALLVQGVVWACPECHHDYDKSAIEAQLVQELMRRSLAFQTQDLVCLKCKQVKADSLQELCSCSGRFSCRLSSSDVNGLRATLKSIAMHHGMDWLLSSIEWMEQL